MFPASLPRFERGPPQIIAVCTPFTPPSSASMCYLVLVTMSWGIEPQNVTKMINNHNVPHRGLHCNKIGWLERIWTFIHALPMLLSADVQHGRIGCLRASTVAPPVSWNNIGAFWPEPQGLYHRDLFRQVNVRPHQRAFKRLLSLLYLLLRRSSCRPESFFLILLDNLAGWTAVLYLNYTKFQVWCAIGNIQIIKRTKI